MNNIIIHISDLHVTESSGSFGFVNKNTHLSTSQSNNPNQPIITTFIDKIKELKAQRCILVVTGDITNIGEEKEFKSAEGILQRIKTELSIDSSKILLIPGDHDVHRRSIQNELDNNNDYINNPYALNEVKFRNFSKLYEKIKEVPFDPNVLIFDKIEIDNIVILGLNSNSKVGTNPANGYFDLNTLEAEINSYTFPEPSHLILAFHHNLSGNYDNKVTGQWDEVNRRELIPILTKHSVKLILCGNEHTANSEILDNTDIILSDSGSFASINPIPTFKVYEIINTPNSLTLNNQVFNQFQTNSLKASSFGNWVSIPSNEISNTELSEFVLYKAPNPPIEAPIELPTLSDPDIPSPQIVMETETEDNEKTDSDIYFDLILQDRLYQIVKSKKLFHSGHFHWSESSRAHNWIDIPKLIETREDLLFVKKLIIEIIKSKNLQNNCDLIVALGSEGNIISSRAAILFEKPYTFLPYSYRYDDSHEFERTIEFNNANKEFKNVLIITDVINDGRTLRKLIKYYEHDFFNNVEKINVVSLFYTGHSELNSNILNSDSLPQDYDKTDDFEVNNITYYAAKHLRIEKCPYGNNYKEECFIYRDQLNCVHLFYNEKSDSQNVQ